MTPVPRLLPFLLVAALGACAEPTPPTPRADARLILTPAVYSLGFVEPHLYSAPDGRLRVNLDVSNPNNFDFPLRTQTDWLDESGRPLDTIQSRPAFRSIPRNGVATIEADAPSTRARNFRMTIDADLR
jgi:hypothetical protein